MMIQLLENFFSDTECLAAIDEINKNKHLWYQCSETKMYVLGKSLLREQFYINGKIRYDKYLDNKQDHFRTQEIFLNKISKIFSKVEFLKDFGRPGFQIIKKNESKNPSVWHYDDILKLYPFQHYFKDYKDYFYEYFENYYVFTLMLSESNSTFDFFPETESKYSKIYDIDESPICTEHVDLVGDQCTNLNCQLKNYKTINYNQGSLLIQERQRVLHRVGSKDLDGDDSYRVTLNSYGVIKNKVLYLFW